MLHKIRKNYEHTIYASYIGYITQAIVNNFAPLLFLTFAAEYDLTLDKITMITTVNFLVQLGVDFLCAKVIDKVGYRPAIMFAHLMSGAGLLGLVFLPQICPSEYMGLLLAVVMYAIGGGIIEVLISPIVEACPTEKKEAAMSLLHSFYCWGHVLVVVISTIFFAVAGIKSWRILACIWAAVPLCNMLYFAKVPIYPITEEKEAMSLGGLLKRKIFWVLIIMMVCAGASEQAMSQWASAFAESALHVSKTIGDIAGPCAFAVCMGTARAIYGKYSERIPLRKMMMGSAILCVCCYLVAVFGGHPIAGLIGCAVCGFSVGIFWPGTFSMAAKQLPAGGTVMYAFMALAGDLGCSTGPTMVGLIASQNNGNLKSGLLIAIVFPILMYLCVQIMSKKGKME